MRRFLQILLGVQIIASVLEFFVLLGQSFLYAVVALALSLLGLVPIIAVLRNMDEIEYLRSAVSTMRSQIRRLQDEVQEAAGESATPAVARADAAPGAWTCVKCGTVNKAGTARCETCKAAYSPETNPTDDPYADKKLSRWVK